jgi:hypothetical protein
VKTKRERNKERDIKRIKNEEKEGKGENER